LFTPEEEIRISEGLIRKWHGQADGRIKVWLGPLAVFKCGPDLIVKAHEIAEKYKVGLHMHVAEARLRLINTLEDYGRGEIEFLYNLGVLGPNFQAVHAVWISTKEIRLLSETNTRVIHNPVSNMYVCDGIAPVTDMLKQGVIVALGTDGPASNDNQDMFETMKVAALLHKVNTLDPMALPTKKVFEMATIDSAKALGMEEEIGSLEPGKKADIVIVNMRHPHIAPVHNVLASLVYCAKGNDVDTTIVDGKILMEDKEVKSLDENEIVAMAQEKADDLRERMASAN
jgi:5-methylthioadenosine/S-adenosylhomocysteine deaminase